MVPRAALLESPYFREFLQPAGISRLCTTVIFGAGDVELPATVLSVYGGLQAPVFDATAKETLRLLVPHLSRSLGVMYQLRMAESRVAASLAALDQIERGVVLLGADGQLIHENRRFREIRSATRSLKIVESGSMRYLATEDPKSDLVLRQWLSGTLRAAAIDTEHFMKGLLLPCGKGLPRLYLSASRLPVDNPYGSNGKIPAAIVFLAEVEATPRLDLSALCTLYRLTPAELRLVEGLAHGHTLTQIAVMQQLNVQTMRDRLKQVFVKTGVRRQAAVVKLALSLGT